ncbi:MAG: glutamine synthetase III [Bernardetiaceae bacterium]
MSISRVKALEMTQQRPVVVATPPAEKISDYFGMNVFNREAMKAFIPAGAYKKLIQAIDKGEKISESLADITASAMKNWAMERGATHYTHWFQPIRGTTAEKHDSFFELSPGGEAIEKFKGSTLVQQEPDASSFPSGGLRNTFEARGYTAWDPTSPAFLFDIGSVRTLCIPSIFVSYTGEALDYKAPLLKSMELLDQAATKVCQYFDRNVTRVTATLGAEQEFFLIDRALFNARPDLVMTGKTVMGQSPSRGQQLSDHYFGSIPARVTRFMQEFEIEALKLGIPITTRHNEVAPGQYECAPSFEDVNLATDHNLLLMDVMRKVSAKHGFKVLFHEKPFAGINGSGKHNNWSMSTNTGINLLSPTSKARENLQFLTFFVNTLKAVHRHADILRAAIASPGNDFRLGANEAPPAIISAFIGSQLSAVLENFENTANVEVGKGENMYIKLGIDKIPPILKDNTDRNRTSPFAFTGNKFELRAVGSLANNAAPMTVLNAIVAAQLQEFAQEVDGLVEKGEKKEIAITQVLRRYVTEAKAIVFEGDGYSQEWVEEAAKRGLSNLRTTPEALEVYGRPEVLEFFEKLGIFTPSELKARQEILLEGYILQTQIESRSLCDLAQNHIVPAAVKYQNQLITNLQGLQSLGVDVSEDARLDTIHRISRYVNQITTNVKEMAKARKAANEMEDTLEMAKAYCFEVKEKYFEPVRYACDKLELLVDDEVWPMVKYREMLFVR